MINWLYRLIIGCSHTYEPYGDVIRHYGSERSINLDIPNYRYQSQRCTKCGDIKVMKV